MEEIEDMWSKAEEVGTTGLGQNNALVLKEVCSPRGFCISGVMSEVGGILDATYIWK